MMKKLKPFSPVKPFRNKHLQSIAASIKMRRLFIRKRAAGMLKQSNEVIVDCGEGVRLQGFHSSHGDRPRDLVILLHGWEGSSDSTYILSSAGMLFNHGYDIFRLNLRDHGTSHHLNKGLFHSCLLDEVIGAIGFIRKTCSDNRKTFLCGFSLGGNFSLRVAARVQESAVKLDKVVAICPVLSPPSTLESLENGVFFYRKYFLRKWRKSLVKKQRIFPDDYTFNNTAAFKTLTGMTDYFVTKYTEFPNLETYLKGYALTGDMLSGIKIPAHIIASMDDPVIPCQDLEALARPQNVTVTLTRFGGHCGFITGPGMKSWVDDALVELVSNDI